MGLGKKNSLLVGTHYDEFHRTLAACDALFILASCIAKLAAALLIHRVSRLSNDLLVLRCVSGAIILWGIVGFIVVCIPPQNQLELVSWVINPR